MTTLREAAQQALEALEVLDRVVLGTRRGEDAIAALRAALAEPVQEPRTIRMERVDKSTSTDWWSEAARIRMPSPELYAAGDTVLCWVNEGDLLMAGLPKRPAEPVQEPVVRVRVNSNVPGRIDEMDVLKALPRGEHLLYIAPPKLPAEPVQEPVAWRYVPSDVWGDAIVTQDPKTVELAQEYGRPVEPLFTAPPQRKPLTEEMATELVRAVVSSSPRPIGMVEYGMLVARALEQAHGIE